MYNGSSRRRKSRNICRQQQIQQQTDDAATNQSNNQESVSGDLQGKNNSTQSNNSARSNIGTVRQSSLGNQANDGEDDSNVGRDQPTTADMLVHKELGPPAECPTANKAATVATPLIALAARALSVLRTPRPRSDLRAAASPKTPVNVQPRSIGEENQQVGNPS